MSYTQNNRRRPKRFRLPLWALTIIIAVGALVLVFLVWSSVWLFGTIRDMAAATDFTAPSFSGDGSSGTDLEPGAVNIFDNEPGEPLPLLSPDTFDAWDGKERVNILLLGIDLRCDEVGPTRTDTMMLLSLDPVSKSASILSMPRDLWVDIPSYGVDRINQAHLYGEIYEYPGGGPALAMETVEGTLGLPIHHYAAVDFNAFVEVVDLIGGIDISVPESINDPSYPDSCYGYDPFFISDGEHHLDGAESLKYARTRATFGGDIDRAGRQQEVVLAVRNQVLSFNMLPQLITKAPQLWQSIQENVETSLSLTEIIQLALLAQDIPPENIQQAVLDFDYVYNETTPDGRQVLVPVREEIRKLRDELFGIAPIPTPEIENLDALMASENARVGLYNGTAEFGLAGRTESYLLTQDVNVTEIGNADSSGYVTSQIIDFGNHPGTVEFLKQEMGVPPLNISQGRVADGEFDVLVIIGSEWTIPGSGIVTPEPTP